KGDLAKAHKLFEKAAELDKKAHNHWVSAGKHWEAREKDLHEMHTEQANAGALRHAAIKLDEAAAQLLVAENDRAAARAARLAGPEADRHQARRAQVVERRRLGRARRASGPGGLFSFLALCSPDGTGRLGPRAVPALRGRAEKALLGSLGAAAALARMSGYG